jgi:branched-chain amino acid transport system permease protein
MKARWFNLFALSIALAVIVVSTRTVQNDYFFAASYTVLQFVVLATAWNILGGFTGYVNFGSAAFFSLGAYSSVVLYTLWKAPISASILLGTLVASVVGLGMGYLTLRLRGVFFSIATLAFSEVLLTFIVNWDFVGGARGAYIILPREAPFGFHSNVQYLFAVMALLAAVAVAVARFIETSMLGRGLAAIRDDELAAECSGVPTLRLKLVSTTVSGGLMGMAGATFPYFIQYVEPTGTFSLAYAVNSIAMPLIGGMSSWLGPVIGAILLGTIQQVVQVTVSSSWNLLIVGVLLVLFVTLAPNGIMGWVARWRRPRRSEP